MRRQSRLAVAGMLTVLVGGGEASARIPASRPGPVIRIGTPGTGAVIRALEPSVGQAVEAAQAPTSAGPVIHSVAVRPQLGTLLLSGTGFGPDLVVMVDGHQVTTLPGASDTQLEVQAPASVLTTPGTYRLTVHDPVRRTWDGFIVASAVPSGGLDHAPGAAHAVAPIADASAPLGQSAPAAAGSATSATAPVPLAVVEDTGSPFRTALGYQALGASPTGLYNTGIGYQALLSISSQGYSTAVGYRALAAATGGFNTAVGTQALTATLDGISNTAVGRQAMTANTSGDFNTAVGSRALDTNATGHQNTALGEIALRDNVAGSFNVAVGNAALVNTTGSSNTGLGWRAGYNALGSANIFLGANVVGTSTDANTMRLGLPFNSATGAGQNRTFIAGIRGTTVSGGEGVYIDVNGQLGSGPVVPSANSVGSAEVIADALTAADLAPGAVATSEIADGAVTAAKVAFPYAASATPGGPASDLGCTACVAATEVSFTFAGLGANTFTGTQAITGGNLTLPKSTASAGSLIKNGVRFLHDAGNRNTFLGAGAGTLTVVGDDNAATGQAALANLGSGSFNTAAGSEAMFKLTSGSGNTASGYSALAQTTTGTMNTAVGYGAGEQNTTGSQNVYLGAGVGGQASDANTMRLGMPYNPTTLEGQRQTFVAGIYGTTLSSPGQVVYIDANGQMGTMQPPSPPPTVGGSGSAVGGPPGAAQEVLVALSAQRELIAAPRPDAALLKELEDQRAVNARQERLIADLLERLARVEARQARAGGR